MQTKFLISLLVILLSILTVKNTWDFYFSASNNSLNNILRKSVIEQSEKNSELLEKNKNLENEINRIADVNDAPFQAIYVQISRGVQLIRNHLPEENLSPTVFITSIKIDDPSDRHKGISALLKDDERWLKTDIKSTSLLANVLNKIEADSEGHDEVILHKGGFLNEGAVSNLFLFINDDLHTPSLDANILPGVTRAKLINLAEANNINVIQRIIPLSEIDNAQEVFMSSTTKGLILSLIHI